MEAASLANGVPWGLPRRQWPATVAPPCGAGSDRRVSIDRFDIARSLFCERFPGARPAWLGGSTVLGMATPTSDLDISVLLDGPPAPYRESLRHQGGQVELFVHTEEAMQHANRGPWRRSLNSDSCSLECPGMHRFTTQAVSSDLCGWLRRVGSAHWGGVAGSIAGRCRGGTDRRCRSRGVGRCGEPSRGMRRDG